jgi:hypothetical protein
MSSIGQMNRPWYFLVLQFIMVELAYAPLRLVRISSRLSEYSRFTSWFLSKLIYPINQKSYPTKVMKNIMQSKVFIIFLQKLEIGTDWLSRTTKVHKNFLKFTIHTTRITKVITFAQN